jgi:biotin carboxyl carrier protein
MSPTPPRKLKVTVNGKLYLVEVGDPATSPFEVSVNGRPYLVTVEAETGVEEGAVVPVDDPEIAVGEQAHPASMAKRKVSAPAATISQQRKVVRAPMPGNILDIAVGSGDEVKFRQQLCALEAMKMKNIIRSPRDGVIASVDVSEGEAVGHGDVLFTFSEPRE